MKVERFNHPPLSEEDRKHLEKLEGVLKKAVADGLVTRDELNVIKVQINSNGKVMIEELELVRQFIQTKVDKGELAVNFFG